MSSSVRFFSASLSNQLDFPSTASKECQTLPVYFSSIGTEPIQLPEKGTQTESQKQRTNSSRSRRWTEEEKMQIRTDLVDLLMEELERAEKEEEILEAFERKLAFEEEKGQRRVQLRHICQLEMPEMDDHFGHHSVTLTSVHCGSNNRISLLFGFPQHEIWCSGHSEAQILIVGTHRGQRGRIITIPLSTCPSTAEFTRYGELLIVGTHSGELLLLSSETGDVLWSSESVSVLTHSFTVTQLRWAKDSDGREQQKELISLSLDGILRKSRLGTDNQLELLQSVRLTLADLPRDLRRGAIDEGTKLGLIGCDFDDEANLLVATETGIILKLDFDGLKLKNAFELGDSPESIEQFNLIQLNPSDEWHFCTQIIWRTSDGTIRCCPLRQQKAVPKETKTLPLAQSRENFQIYSDHRILLAICQSEKGRSELIEWDFEKGRKMALPRGENGEATGEPRMVGGRGQIVAVVTEKTGGEQSQRLGLELYEVTPTNDR